jgi:hypothetical protein
VGLGTGGSIGLDGVGSVGVAGRGSVGLDGGGSIGGDASSGERDVPHHSSNFFPYVSLMTVTPVRWNPSVQHAMS